MTELTLTRDAAAGLYAATTSLIVGHDITRQYQSVIPEEVAVFILHPSGLVACKGEAGDGDDSGIPFIGLPYGLLGIVISKSYRPRLSDFLQYAEQQKPKNNPELLVVSRLPFLGRYKLTAYISRLLSRELGAEKTQLSHLERQLVSLREKNEQLSLGFEKARRMIVGAGYSTRTICYDLPPGDQMVGPAKSAARHSYSQVLPVDLTSLTGVTLFVAEAATDTAGSLDLIIRRRSDSAIIGVSRVSYESFTTGWYYFTLPDVTGRSFGDAILQLEWQGTGGPKFALANEVADRFGASDTSTLALRIERGLADISTLTEPDQSSRHIAYHKLDAATLAAQGHFWGGTEEQTIQSTALGSEVLQLDANGAWVQLHALEENMAALLVPSVLPQNTIRVQAPVSLAHSKAAPCLAVMVTGPVGAVTKKAVEGLIQHFDTETGDLHGQSGDLSWKAAILSQGASILMDFEFEQPTTNEQDLLLGVLPLIAGRNDRSWCRWHKLHISQKVAAAADVHPLPKELFEYATRRPAQIRAHRFPEIADHLSFYRGKQAHIALREELGFWPIEFSDDTGAMQLNAMDEDFCAVTLSSGLPENTRRISCEVGTAHQLAGLFTYVIGVFPEGTNAQGAVDTILTEVKNGTLDGQTDTGLNWAAKTIPPIRKATLALDFSVPTTGNNGVFFAVLPTESGRASFGWCRWYLLSFEMIPNNASEMVLEADPLKGAVGE